MGEQNWLATAASQENLKKWHSLSIEEKRTQLAYRRKMRADIYQQHIHEGITLQELADKYNTNKTAISLHIAKHANKLAKKRDYDIPAERRQQYDQLKALMETTFKRGLEGDDFAIKSYVSLAARFAKVIGLDAPTRFQHEVNKKVSHTHTHTVDLDDLAKRIEIIRARQKMLEARNNVATPFSGQEPEEKTPVLSQSSGNSNFAGLSDPNNDSENVIDLKPEPESPSNAFEGLV